MKRSGYLSMAARWMAKALADSRGGSLVPKWSFMVGALSSASPSTFLSLKTSRVRTDLRLAATVPDVRTLKSTSPVTAPATVFLPPESGIRLKLAPVCSPSARMPMDAGCAMRLVPTLSLRFFPSSTIWSMWVNLLRLPTKTQPGSVSTRPK